MAAELSGVLSSQKNPTMYGLMSVSDHLCRATLTRMKSVFSHAHLLCHGVYQPHEQVLLCPDACKKKEREINFLKCDRQTDRQRDREKERENVWVCVCM